MDQNCKDRMQFAALVLGDDKRLLVHADEYAALTADAPITMQPTDETDFKPCVAYGAIIPAYDLPLAAVRSFVLEHKGYAYARVFTEQDGPKCRLSEVADCELYEPVQAQGLPMQVIPCAVYLRTIERVPTDTDENALPLFLRFSNIHITQNVANRSCILAVRGILRSGDAVCADNWREGLDPARAVRLAAQIA